MKACLSTVPPGLALGGCAMAPAGSSVAGADASNPVREDPGRFQGVDGRSRVVTTDLTLTLYPDGSVHTWQQMFFDGGRVRFSGLATYHLMTNSRRSWSLADGRPRLHSVGPSNIVTGMFQRQRGRSITPEDSEAAAFRPDGHRVIRRQGTEYLFHGDAPIEPAGPPPVGVTPSSGAPPPPSDLSPPS